MSALPFVQPARDIIVAVTVTDRPDALERLLSSLRPVDDDARLHVIVVDNSAQPCSRIAATVSQASRRSRGQRTLVTAARAQSPLHVSRRELSEVVARRCSANGLRDPIVWMVDDDITFEELRRDVGTLACVNVAEHRIATVRALAQSHPEVDVLVSGFTGDPPIRPNAVLALQLSDLTAELRRLGPLDGSDRFTLRVAPPAYEGDYYYDHAEDSRASAAEFPWLMRQGCGPSVGEQTARMLLDACDINRGRTPFRPLLSTQSNLEITPARTPRRGGNAVFFSTDALLAHEYPSFETPYGWSRRGDMIGATLLAAGTHHVAEGCLTLRHDRSGQGVVRADLGQWVPEFAGIMLARLVMSDPGDAGDLLNVHLDELVATRVQRIAAGLSRARAGVRDARCALRDPGAFWWRSCALALHARALDERLCDLDATLSAACDADLLGFLQSHQIKAQVATAWRDLHRGVAA